MYLSDYERLLPSVRATVRYAASLLVLLLVWGVAVSALDIESFLLPHPVAVLETLWVERFSLAEAAVFTFRNAVFGGVIGISAALLVALLCAYSKSARWLIEPYLTVFQSFPREAFFPLIVVWLGFGAESKIANSILLSFFPMAVITLNGLLDTRKEYLLLFGSWHSSRLQELVLCRLPNSVPIIISAAKVAMPLALIGAVLGEFLGGSSGLGYIIVNSGSSFRVDRLFAAVTILAFGGTLLIALIEATQHFLLRRFKHEKE